MSNVVPFSKKPEPPKQWASGEAFCISCGHRWVAVVETGTKHFECPGCRRHTGQYLFGFMPSEGQLVRSCNCGNQLFYLTPDGHMCANCGTYQSYC